MRLSTFGTFGRRQVFLVASRYFSVRAGNFGRANVLKAHAGTFGCAGVSAPAGTFGRAVTSWHAELLLARASIFDTCMYFFLRVGTFGQT